MSLKPEDIPFKEAGDLKDEIGVNCFKTQLRALCFHTIAIGKHSLLPEPCPALVAVICLSGCVAVAGRGRLATEPG